jgi:hypothetical protein
VSIREHTSAYVSIRQHSAAALTVRVCSRPYEKNMLLKRQQEEGFRQGLLLRAYEKHALKEAGGGLASAYVSLRQHTSAEPI